MFKRKQILTVILSVFILCGVSNATPVFAQDINIEVTGRLSGSDRYATSIAVSQAGWTQGASTIIIATGLDYPDALSAASLAKSNNAPILLTEKNALRSNTLTEIKRLNPTHAILIGGIGVVSTNVESQLKVMGINVTRLGGINRYETSKKVAEQLGTNNGIIVATGLNFPDALSIAPIAGIKSMPILLSPKSSLDPYVSAFIKGKSIPVSYIVGGTGVLEDRVASSVPNSNRLGGDNRYLTNLKINDKFKNLNFNTVYLATGGNFPDALSGSALAAKNNAPIILTDSSSISSDTINFLKSKGVQHVVILGGTGAVSKAVEDAVKNIKVTIPDPIINVTSVSLNKSEAALTTGDTYTLTAAVAPSNAANKAVTWTSSNTAAATVDNSGKVTAVSAGTATITVKTADGGKTASCAVTVYNVKEHGYVYNPELNIDLKIRSSASTVDNTNVVGCLYNYEKIEILDTINSSITWDKIIYSNSIAYVSDAYIQHYTSPKDDVVSVALGITKQFEVGTADQIAGNFDGEGLSLGYLQWCIGQGTLQLLLNRMDRQYNAEMKNIFGTNYDAIHNMIQDTQAHQLAWAVGINDSSNKISEPWYSQFVSLTKNEYFMKIEKDAEVYTVKQAIFICDRYKLNTVRGFALAFDIVNQNGSISSDAAKVIDAAVQQNSNIAEKDLLTVIANAVSNNDDIKSRKMAIVNGQGTVHNSLLNLDKDYGLSDNCWR